MPRITRIERQKRHAARVSVFVDDEFALGLCEEIAFRFSLCKGMEFTDELRKRLESANSVLEAKIAADRLLARRPYSGKELRDRLRGKGFPPEAVDEAVEAYLRAGLIDDAAFAIAFIKDRMAFRPRSRRMLEMELRAKGVSPSVASGALDDVFGHGAELKTAMSIATKYLDRHVTLPELIRYRRVFALLRRRGFDPATIREALGGHAPEPDEAQEE